MIVFTLTSTCNSNILSRSQPFHLLAFCSAMTSRCPDDPPSLTSVGVERYHSRFWEIDLVSASFAGGHAERFPQGPPSVSPRTTWKANGCEASGPGKVRNSRLSPPSRDGASLVWFALSFATGVPDPSHWKPAKAPHVVRTAGGKSRLWMDFLILWVNRRRIGEKYQK